MKYDNISFINWNDWNELDFFINPDAKIYGNVDLVRHIRELREYAKRKVLTLKWSV